MNVSSGWWLGLGLARLVTRGVALAIRAALLSGHIGSWLPQTRLGLHEREREMKALPSAVGVLSAA